MVSSFKLASTEYSHTARQPGNARIGIKSDKKNPSIIKAKLITITAINISSIFPTLHFTQRANAAGCWAVLPPQLPYLSQTTDGWTRQLFFSTYFSLSTKNNLLFCYRNNILHPSGHLVSLWFTGIIFFTFFKEFQLCQCRNHSFTAWCGSPHCSKKTGSPIQKPW